MCYLIFRFVIHIVVKQIHCGYHTSEWRQGREDAPPSPSAPSPSGDTPTVQCTGFFAIPVRSHNMHRTQRDICTPSPEDEVVAQIISGRNERF